MEKGDFRHRLWLYARKSGALATEMAAVVVVAAVVMVAVGVVGVLISQVHSLSV